MRHLLLALTFLLSLSCFPQRVTNTSIRVAEDLNETTIAVNPLNKSEMVSASNIDAFLYSVDSGENWEMTSPSSELGIYGDPVLHYANGQLFYAHLSKTSGKKYGDWFDRIVVQKVKNVDPWESESFSVGLNEPKMQDKPWLSSDELSDKYRGNLYVSWTEFDKYDSDLPEHRSRIQFSYYTPASNTFSAAITISDTTGDCVDSDNTLEGAVTAVGRNGEIYAVWAGHENLYFDKSTDGGKSWGKDKIIAHQHKGWDMDMPYIMRANGMPFMSYDHINHIIYICWADERDGTADIWLKYSMDGGENWSSDVKINRNGDYSHEYFPNMAFDANSQRVKICYLDQSLSTSGKFFSISLASFSANHPKDIEYVDVSGLPYPLAGERFFFGDYIDLDFNESSTFVIYAGYERATSFLNIASIGNDWSFGMPTDLRSSKPSLLVNKDSLFLIFNSDTECLLKGKLNYYQKSEKGKIKFKFNSNSSLYVEAILAEEQLAIEEPVLIKVKYKKKDLISGKKTKESFFTYLP